MAVKKPKRSVKPELADTQKAYLKNYQEEVSECILNIADSMERQQTTYGEQKSHSWRHCRDNIKDKSFFMHTTQLSFPNNLTIIYHILCQKTIPYLKNVF